MAEVVSSITLGELYIAIIGISVLCNAIWKIIDGIIKTVAQVKAPEELQNERIKAIEERLSNHDKLFSNDNARLASIEESNKLTQRALLGLLKHGIDGNEIESMKKAQQDIENYLINR